MAKNKKKKVRHQAPQPKETGKSTRLLNHGILILLTLLACYLLLNSNAGYRGLKDNFIMNNVKFILARPNLTYDQKMGAKFPKDYPYVQFLKSNTPDSAVILLPPRSLKSMLGSTNGAQNKLWDEYFLYPRKLLNVDEKDNPLLAKVNYVAIINNWGYDYIQERYGIHYDKKVPYSVVPVREAKQQ